MRAAYGQDARYWWSITPNGRVFLTCIHFGLKDKAANDWLKPRVNASSRLAAACDGSAFTPAYASLRAPLRIHCDGLPQNPGRPALAANLPLPKT
ncbi:MULTISPECIES: hypothetical protein [unclassified Hyphomonas]|uniref:hypothetical protein n=1 Tax=unclassified Hyphomonas TaxID=2630699 RepID=UPI00045918B5|nr:MULTISPECIES: hypothetical protein [unclassified Hyphomonas]KCZ50101.1 hypothetical protein HY17_03030 [Hyphomonas sp. CY54-11-8]